MISPYFRNNSQVNPQILWVVVGLITIMSVRIIKTAPLQEDPGVETRSLASLSGQTRRGQILENEKHLRTNANKNASAHMTAEDLTAIQADDASVARAAYHTSRVSNRDNDRHMPSVKIECEPTSTETLRQMLGPAFNARYMSISRPYLRPSVGMSLAGGMVGDEPIEIRRRHDPANHHGQFRVPEGFERDLPSDYVSSQHRRHHHGQHRRSASERFLSRVKRAKTSPRRPGGGRGGSPPWQCDSRIVWDDLGSDHFPRFLRTVECTQQDCWFGHYSCVPRAFTVNVLRRKTDACVPVYGNPTGQDDRREIIRYEHEWIFEERSVTFCCDCSAE
ncbi:protein trunk-like [Lingula anatina]|uniref:Protein trunk-like n=1 Tax=Lingula anatina TaxID=7574 RepID=A0A1S3K204_LINAN|nr:protein trunk-like [Lingula anatina]|eukprot:XP_013416660.1 protein trunk-like [Lingula anatina]